MCGIAGVVSWDEKFRVSRDMLLKMSASIAHRGPDGEGILLTREHEPIDADHPQVAFAFRRLAILDPDPRAMQPFTIGHLTLIFNGEIYNFRELKAELSKLRPDYQWRTTGDTEVLLMSYQEWGEKCVEHLIGQFAFAVWDEQEKSLYLARDRMGEKPLYISHFINQDLSTSTIAFASERSALIGRVEHEPSQSDQLIRYLRYGWTTGSQLELRLTALTRHNSGSYRDYFSLSNTAAQSAPAPGGILAQTKTLVERAVRRQLVSDVPLGVFLSGGIDSSVVALCARKSGRVDTFTISFDDARYDESRYARDVAKHLGTNHHEFRVSQNAIDDLPKLAEVLGEPFADSSAIPMHYLARETRKHVKVALSGDGGDELFGGYDRYRAMQLASRLRGLPNFVATIARSWTGGHPKSKLTRAARFAESVGLSDAERYDSYIRIFGDAAIHELLKEDPGRRGVPLCLGVGDVFATELARTGDPVTAALATDRVTYLPNDLLTKVDRACMLHALEVRAPFMDHELVQFAAGLTSDQLLKGGPKRMLREAFAHELPGFVFKRKKMGFAVPIGEWFRGELRPMLRDHLFASDSFAKQHFNMKVVERLVDEHEQSRVDHSQRLYALLMLELWWNTREGIAIAASGG
ncbi:MAG: asparagine synthase (glutamine-hydrolyzing) [Anaerolineae bacterium]|nr:asparagine synthase (glutamine-hydrolyzing) [Phycisphaerae bacterium]